MNGLTNTGTEWIDPPQPEAVPEDPASQDAEPEVRSRKTRRKKIISREMMHP